MINEKEKVINNLKKTMPEKKEVVIYTKKMKQWLLISGILSLFTFFLNYFKDQTAINYIFWFLLVLNWISFLFIIYVLSITIIESIKVAGSKNNVDNYSKNFKY